MMGEVLEWIGKVEMVAGRMGSLQLGSRGTSRPQVGFKAPQFLPGKPTPTLTFPALGLG